MSLIFIELGAVVIGLAILARIASRLGGYWAGRRAGIERRGALRAGVALVARGEFSIVIAGFWRSRGPILARIVGR